MQKFDRCVGYIGSQWRRIMSKISPIYAISHETTQNKCTILHFFQQGPKGKKGAKGMRGSDGRPVSEANSFVFVFSLLKEWKTAASLPQYALPGQGLVSLYSTQRTIWQTYREWRIIFCVLRRTSSLENELLSVLRIRVSFGGCFTNRAHPKKYFRDAGYYLITVFALDKHFS